MFFFTFFSWTHALNATSLRCGAPAHSTHKAQSHQTLSQHRCWCTEIWNWDKVRLVYVPVGSVQCNMSAFKSSPLLWGKGSLKYKIHSIIHVLLWIGPEIFQSMILYQPLKMIKMDPCWEQTRGNKLMTSAYICIFYYEWFTVKTDANPCNISFLDVKTKRCFCFSPLCHLAPADSCFNCHAFYLQYNVGTFL